MYVCMYVWIQADCIIVNDETRLFACFPSTTYHLNNLFIYYYKN